MRDFEAFLRSQVLMKIIIQAILNSQCNYQFFKLLSNTQIEEKMAKIRENAFFIYQFWNLLNQIRISLCILSDRSNLQNIDENKADAYIFQFFIQKLVKKEQTLLSKMNIDSIYIDHYQDRPSPFNTIAKPSSKMSKLKSQKILKSPQLTSKMSIQQIQKQILKQISITENTMRIFNEDLSALIGKKLLTTVSNDHPSKISTTSPININKLRNIQQSIRRKDQIIRQIDEDIKMLKNGTYYDTKEKFQENNFQKFINQIKDQRQNLIRSQNMLMGKVREVNNKKDLVKNMEGKYWEKCKKQGIEILTFEAFKEAELKRRKEMKKIEKYRKGSHKKMGSSIKQYPNHSSKQLPQVNNNSIHGADLKKMKDLLNRKNVAETALKTAKKKHILELNDLYGKRDFLLDENQDLEDKLILKQNELNMAEKKFSETRGSISAKKILERRYKTEKNL